MKIEKLLGRYTIMYNAYYNENMNVAVYVHRDETIRYYYWMDIWMPSCRGVIL